MAETIALIPSGYKATKVYSQLPVNGNGDLNFARASEATRVNKDGLIETVGSNVPRLDYTDGGCPSLLLEPQSTNLITYSEDFTNWTASNATVTSNTNTSPSGETTSDSVEDASGVSFGNVASNSYTFLSADYNLSIYIKKKSSSTNWIGIEIAGNGSYLTFNSFTGTQNFIGSNIYSDVSITSFNDNYWKLSFTTAVSATTATAVRIFPSISNNGTSLSATATGTEVFWGAQLEQLSYPTSYIPTYGASVTRGKDSCSKTGISSLIGQTEGVIYYDYTATFESPSTSFDFFPISVSDSTSSNLFFLNNYNQRLNIGYNVSGTPIISNNSFTFNSGDRIKVAFAYKQNDFAVYINGTQILTLNSGSVAALSEITLGNYYNNTASLQDDVKVNELRFYNTRLTNTELQALTTI